MTWRRALAPIAFAAVTVGVVLAGAAFMGTAHRAPVAVDLAEPVISDGVPALGFVPPAVGTYALERILHVPDGVVLDSDGSTRALHELTTGKITLFSFIYTYCADPQGCPLAYASLHALKDLVAGDPVLRGHVRLVSMSFDPAYDTPAMMRSYGGADAQAGASVPWHFLTTASTVQLAPILAGMGQDVAVLAPRQPGQRAPILRHLLRVYLIDAAGDVREIYSTAYLHPQVLRNDIATLLQERHRDVPTAGARLACTAGAVC